MQDVVDAFASTDFFVPPPAPALQDSPARNVVSIPARQDSFEPPPLPIEGARTAIARERAEITERVANFRELQARLGRERSQYYETIQARIRQSLGT
jgi:hypothetical protein